ncbi:MAG: hypothetical protein J6W84_06000 [Bacteroidales bacterium]|nr:hypothetical protein [Bacteroidales bacterium]
MDIKDTISAATTSPKEVMRKNLRDALGSKLQQPASNENLNAATLPPMTDAVQTFVQNFRNSGGKCKICESNQIMGLMVQFLKAQKYERIFCNCPSFMPYFQAGGVQVLSALNNDFPPEIVVAYADMMIARSGGFVFTQKFSLYPSLKNIAQDILVIGSVTRIVSDIHNALEVLAAEDTKSNTGLVEIVTPSQPENIGGSDSYSKLNPRIILLLAKD